MRRIVVSLSLLVGIAGSAGVAQAQEGIAIVDPGMTKSQVIERLGQPASERSRGEHTYLFFQNGCERECGMSDLVMLRADTVIDAIFRSSQRRYTGTSSSPSARTPQVARARSTSAPLAVPARATDVGTPEPVRADAAVRPAPAEERASSRSSAPATIESTAATGPVVTPASSSPTQNAVATPAVAVWPPAGAEPVRALPAADTIKGSPNAVPSAWPSPATKPVADSLARAARAADSAAAAQAARERATMTTWPPPRVRPPADSGAAPPKPPED